MSTPIINEPNHQPVLPVSPSIVRWIPISAFVILGIAVGLSITIFRVGDSTVAGTIIGFLFVQMLVAAVWTTLAPIGLFTRLIIGTIFTLLLCMCMYYCANRDGGGPAIAIPITSAMFAQWLIYQLPLWYLRNRGWALKRADALVENRRKEMQFGIRHLLIWTTVVAIFMALARLLISQVQIDEAQISSAIQMGLHLTLGNSLIALPIVWGCLSRRYFWVWMLITITMFVVVCLVQWYTLGARNLEYQFIWIVNLAQAIMAIIAMLALRFTGYRMQLIAE